MAVALRFVTMKVTPTGELRPMFAKLSMLSVSIVVEKEVAEVSNAEVDLIVCLTEVPSLISYSWTKLPAVEFS
jgi:hypothetical protein